MGGDSASLVTSSLYLGLASDLLVHVGTVGYRRHISTIVQRQNLDGREHFVHSAMWMLKKYPEVAEIENLLLPV